MILSLIAAMQHPAPLFSKKKAYIPRTPKPENLAIGRIVREYREKHGDSQAEFAGVIGRKRATVGMYEAGIIKMPYQFREHASRRYGIPPHRLGLDTDEQESSVYDLALTLALHVIRSVDDVRARDLAAEFIKARLASK